MSKIKEQIKKNQPCKDAGSILVAQNAKLCVPGNVPGLPEYEYLIKIIEDTRLSFVIRLLIDFMLSSGCRVSAAIYQQGFFVRYGGTIDVYEPKTKQHVIFRSIYFNSYYSRLPVGYCRQFTHLSRFQVYRVFVKLGINYSFEGSVNNTVTHAPRHIVALTTISSTGNINDVKEVLKHKSSKSSENYVREKNK